MPYLRSNPTASLLLAVILSVVASHPLHAGPIQYFKKLFGHVPRETPPVPHEVPQPLATHPAPGGHLPAPSGEALAYYVGRSVAINGTVRTIKNIVKATCPELLKLEAGDKIAVDGLDDIVVHSSPDLESGTVGVIRPLKQGFSGQVDELTTVTVVETKTGECWISVQTGMGSSQVSGYIRPLTIVYVLSPISPDALPESIDKKETPAWRREANPLAPAWPAIPKTDP